MTYQRSWKDQPTPRLRTQAPTTSLLVATLIVALGYVAYLDHLTSQLLGL